MLGQSRLAISIEGQSLRLLACRGRKVRWWAEAEIEPRLLRNGFLVDGRGFAQALTTAVQTGKAPKRQVFAALSGYQSFSRVISVPKGVGRKLGAVVTGEARRTIPDIERTMFLFWQTCGKPDAMHQSVFLLAVQRQPLITYFEALCDAEMRPKSLDLRPLALARAVNQEDAIIGNAESTSLDVIIVRNDIPVVMRSLYLGEEFQALEYINTRLAEELARTVNHFNSTSQNGSLAPTVPIFLTGAGTADPNLQGMVRELTQHPLAPLQVPFEYPDDFPVDRFVVHLGLMLKRA